MPVSYRNLPKRSVLVFLTPIPTTPPPTLPTSPYTLANFLGRRVRSTDRPRQRQTHCSRSQPPQPPAVVLPSLPTNQELYSINQANASEPIYPSVNQFYANGPRPTRNTSLLPDQNNLQHATPPPTEPHQIPVRSQELHYYIPEDIYISSVLPTRTH